MIDNYTLKARLYPLLILFFPIIIAGVFYSIEFNQLAPAITTCGLAGALTYLFSQLGRDKGKQKEPKLWESWGGSPSVQLLRFRDLRIDSHTKQRYHQKLQQLCPLSIIPDSNLENTNPAGIDEAYQAWCKYLISQTRDKNKFALLLKDNTSYGFRRNLWGLKVFAIIINIALLVINCGYWYFNLQTFNLLVYPSTFYYTIIALLLNIAFWAFLVNRRWVKIPAFSYAERLCESIDQL